MRFNKAYETRILWFVVELLGPTGGPIGGPTGPTTFHVGPPTGATFIEHNSTRVSYWPATEYILEQAMQQAVQQAVQPATVAWHLLTPKPSNICASNMFRIHDTVCWNPSGFDDIFLPNNKLEMKGLPEDLCKDCIEALDGSVDHAVDDAMSDASESTQPVDLSVDLIQSFSIFECLQREFNSFWPY